MSNTLRSLLLVGAMTSLASLSATAPGHAQGRGALASSAIDGVGDDDRLFQDQTGALYRLRAGRYEPYAGRVEFGRAVPDRAATSERRLAPERQQLAERPPETLAESPADAPAAPLTVGPKPGANQLSPAMAAAINRPIDNGPISYDKAYAAIADDAFPVAAFNWKKTNPAFLRQEIAYTGPYEPGTIIVDPRAHQLTLVQADGRARRYGVGVGKQGFSWSGTATVNLKQAWPDWYPPKEMIARTPHLAREVDTLPSGVGVPGGNRNPLGARAMYLWQGNKDTLFRIHGTLDPNSIGKSVSSGCIRMINQDAIDLFSRVNVGTKVVVLN
ncbi:L,D-transpeptidase [Methylobacterium sp. WL30]|jgi:lipoprotein-anchoring transpeptidase ErfK/SrfK|uniref:L,D-transpeptidase n=1 Tax=unclassified Methylobacterium TaxID=2615210 RepID=UPI0011CCA555|nr:MULTISPECIES: L,D-transpeptidase [unclassified Methylobacterium]MCJ2077691.1 L,D-transpeptidase [Methylobacterium sp. E-016]TXN50676.1 L,D-transpeptidase [Methylobacterium sp. WL119]TXN65460.1 L,D-transpeptidase [Methylobacterium sp. WL30]